MKSDREQLQEVLREHGLDKCSCGYVVDEGAVSWNEASTEAGTGYAVLNLICPRCGEEILYLHTWDPDIDDLAGFVDTLRAHYSDIKRYIRLRKQ